MTRRLFVCLSWPSASRLRELPLTAIPTYAHPHKHRCRWLVATTETAQRILQWELAAVQHALPPPAGRAARMHASASVPVDVGFGAEPASRDAAKQFRMLVRFYRQV